MIFALFAFFALFHYFHILSDFLHFWALFALFRYSCTFSIFYTFRMFPTLPKCERPFSKCERVIKSQNRKIWQVLKQSRRFWKGSKVVHVGSKKSWITLSLTNYTILWFPILEKVVCLVQPLERRAHLCRLTSQNFPFWSCFAMVWWRNDGVTVNPPFQITGLFEAPSFTIPRYLQYPVISEAEGPGPTCWWRTEIDGAAAWLASSSCSHLFNSSFSIYSISLFADSSGAADVRSPPGIHF